MKSSRGENNRKEKENSEEMPAFSSKQQLRQHCQQQESPCPFQASLVISYYLAIDYGGIAYSGNYGSVCYTTHLSLTERCYLIISKIKALPNIFAHNDNENDIERMQPVRREYKI